MRQWMQESVLQTANAGVLISDKGPLYLYIIQQCTFLHSKSCMQDSLLQTACAGTAISEGRLQCLSNRRL